MGKYRIPSKNSEYYIPREDYLTAIHFSLRYPLWLEEIKGLEDTSAAIRYDRDKVQTSSDYDSTAEAAVRIAKIRDKVTLVEEVIRYVSHDMDYWIKLGVCYGLTFDQLKNKGMPCERDTYYLMRRHYYYELCQRI